MKKLILILFVIVPIVTLGQTWDYPVKPGTEDWKKYKSNEDMVKSCQIPKGILQSLSTNELIDICLRYPLLYDVFAFNDTDAGLAKLFYDFNGIRALYKRKDALDNLIKKYTDKINSFSFLNETHSELEKGDFIISVDIMELILSRSGSQRKNIAKKEAKNILRSLVYGYEAKIKYIKYFKGSGLLANINSRTHIIAVINGGSIMNQDGESKEILQYSESGMTNEEFVQMINELSYQLIR